MKQTNLLDIVPSGDLPFTAVQESLSHEIRLRKPDVWDIGGYSRGL
jgi:hypothetical protein